MRELFVRFGNVPLFDQSINWKTEKAEIGVSVYRAVEIDGVVNILLPKDRGWFDTFVSSLASVLDRTCYEVTDTVLPHLGSDGEPLLVDIAVVREIPSDEIPHPRVVLKEPTTRRDSYKNALDAFELDLPRWEVNMIHSVMVCLPDGRRVPKASASFIHLAGILDEIKEGVVSITNVFGGKMVVDPLVITHPELPNIPGTEFTVEFYGEGYATYRIEETNHGTYTTPRVRQIEGNFKKPVVFLHRQLAHKYKVEQEIVLLSE